ncbi:hypothetical protein JKP88DRAFT_175650 [Tribonema minus]|uniref:TRP C-terminal domain-containing protein n=1 Tax=Tribonema minus TaxID=303371 RepID=A0A836CM90_9STRA|nr:hypothetical protein JKP88DRAFT_175650 [Tribonema minus]
MFLLADLLPSPAAGTLLGGAYNTAARCKLNSLRIPIVVVQVLSGFLTITSLHFPAALEHLLDRLSFLTQYGFFLSCVVSMTFYTTLLLVTLVPLGLAAIIATHWYLVAWLRKRRPQNMRGNRAPTVHKHSRVLIALAFYVFSITSGTIFQTFGCSILEEVGASGTSDLRADYSKECGTTEHRRYQAYAWCMIIVYPIGVPALFAWLLYKKRAPDHAGGTAETAAEQDVSSFLWQPYKPGLCRYWELVECLRRLALTGFLVFIMPGTAGQAAWSMLFAFASIVIFMAAKPHAELSQSRQYMLGGLIIYLSTTSARLEKLDYTHESSQGAVGILLALLTSALIATGVILALHGACDARHDIGAIRDAIRNKSSNVKHTAKAVSQQS